MIVPNKQVINPKVNCLDEKGIIDDRTTYHSQSRDLAVWLVALITHCM